MILQYTNIISINTIFDSFQSKTHTFNILSSICLHQNTFGVSEDKKIDANLDCDFVTNYHPNSKEDMSEIYGVMFVKPSRLNEKFLESQSFCQNYNSYQDTQLYQKEIFNK
ncbi:MAG: hypothetical protein HC932_04955 [Thermales bacterium]|nr:hypothetical protein [Thermales bacterium]